MAKGNRGGKRRSGSSGQGLTQDQKDAIEYYVSGDGMFINNVLRERNGMSESDLNDTDRELIKDLDDALNKNLNGETLYRSVDASAIFGDMSQSDYYDLLSELNYGTYSNEKGAYSQTIAKKVNNMISKAEGNSFVDKGYVSTSRSESFAQEFGNFTGSDKPIVMKIKTSKNTKGADVSKATKRLAEIERNDPQHETLLARNQKYTVTKIYSKNGNIYVDVSMD